MMKDNRNGHSNGNEGRQTSVNSHSARNLNKKAQSSQKEVTKMKPRGQENVGEDREDVWTNEESSIMQNSWLSENHLLVPAINNSTLKTSENEIILKRDDEAEDREIESTRKMKASDIAIDLMDLYRFCIMDAQLYMYCESKGAWQIIMESEAHRMLRRIIPDNQHGYINKQVLYEIYEWLLAYVNKVTPSVEARHYINFEDCALNWSTGEVVEKRRKFYFKYALPFKYQDALSKQNGSFVTFVEDVFGEDEDTRREFCKFLGLCLSNIRDLKYAFFLYGRSNSGKSVMLNLLQSLMGSESCSSLSFTQMGNEFAITQLLGKRLNLSGEVSGVSNKRLDIFKSLTGNDWVTACFKGKDHFQFISESTLVFACNSFPTIGALEEFDSFLSRIIIFPFNRVKPRNQWIDNLSEILLKDVGTIIEMAVAGLRDLEDDKFCFEETESMLLSKQEFVGKYNSFALFADKYIIEDCKGSVTSNQIREQYRAFCSREDYVALADNVWAQYLKQRFACSPCTLTVESVMGTERARGYRGIRLNCNYDIESIDWREELECYLR